MLCFTSSLLHFILKNLYIYIGEKEGKRRERKLRDYTVYLYKKRKKLLFLYLLYKKTYDDFLVCVCKRCKRKREFFYERI